LKNRAYGGEAVPKDIIKADGAPEYDPWEDVVEVQDPRFTYLEKAKPVRAPRTLKEAPISLLQGAKAIPAVTKPKAGLSYNPTFHEYDRLLTEEGDKEVKAEKKRIREAKEEEERLARIEAAQNERDDIQTEDESAWEGIESEYETAEWLKKRRPERKTPAERNKVKRRKVAERQMKHDAEMKRGAQQAERIKVIAQEMKEQEFESAVAVVRSEESSDEEIDDRVLRRRKLGKAPYVSMALDTSDGNTNFQNRIPERPLELVLPDELQDSLRLLKPEGNLLNDRFRSIMVRGKMETRKPIQQGKRTKRTYTEKWTYKDFTVSA